MKLQALSLALTVGLLSGCVVNLADPPTPTPSALPSATIANGVTIAGMVRAPEGVISTGGGNVISTGGGNLGGAGLGGVISTGGGNLAPAGRQLLAVTENALANTEVFVADAAGNKIPGIPSGVTDSEGRFELKGVPSDRTFVVVARAKTAQGKDAQLQTLAKTTDVGTTANVDVNTTLVTAGVVQTSGAKLGNFNPATFATAVQATQKALKVSDVPDLSDRAAVAAQVQKLINEVAELRTAIDEIRKELEEIKKELKDLRSEVERLKANQASAPVVGAPGAAPGSTSSDPCAQLYAAIDANRDQSHNLNEWLTAWRPTGTTESDIGFMFGYYDADFNDAVSAQEFERFCFDLNASAGGTSGTSDDAVPDAGSDDDVPGDDGEAGDDAPEDAEDDFVPDEDNGIDNDSGAEDDLGDDELR